MDALDDAAFGSSLGGSDPSSSSLDDPELSGDMNRSLFFLVAGLLCGEATMAPGSLSSLGESESNGETIRSLFLGADLGCEGAFGTFKWESCVVFEFGEDATRFVGRKDCWKFALRLRVDGPCSSSEKNN